MFFVIKADMSSSRLPKYEICVARCNENLGWLTPFAPNVCVINKGDITTIPEILRENIIQVPNLGLDQYCHLTYVINRYDSLPEVVVFTQGIIRDHHDIFEPCIRESSIKICDSYNTYARIIPCTQIIKELIEQAAVIGHSLNAAAYVRTCGPRQVISCASYYMTVSGVECTTQFTFGEWFEKHIDAGAFPPEDSFLWFKNSVFAVESKYIHSRPKAYYEGLLHQITQPRQDVLHFLERSWYYMLNLHRAPTILNKCAMLPIFIQQKCINLWKLCQIASRVIVIGRKDTIDTIKIANPLCTVDNVLMDNLNQVQGSYDLFVVDLDTNEYTDFHIHALLSHTKEDGVIIVIGGGNDHVKWSRFCRPMEGTWYKCMGVLHDYIGCVRSVYTIKE